MSTPWRIPLEWGDPRNFQWEPPTARYLCLLCGKYADDAHIGSKTHTRREKDPDTYLWYLGENRQLSQPILQALPPPPPGPPPDYWNEKHSTCTQRSPRGYHVGVPAPPRHPPPDFDTAPVTRINADKPELAEYTCTTQSSESLHIVTECDTFQLPPARASTVDSNDSNNFCHKLKLARHADPNQSYGAVPIAVECGDALQLPPVQAFTGPVETVSSPYLDDTNTTTGAAYERNDAKSTVVNRWHRYAVDATRTSYWWWNPVHHDCCFREDAPGEWIEYLDPLTKQTYWYLSHEIWFWASTGSTMC